ncbi:ATPase [Campylobacter sp. CCUG 57310]|uniref:ATPase n=1 Tax=Campylobacter sp. CCUG 57310 TaxID=2517362 RepID=UPI001567B1A9|nr:ATPase [Campylobacter sp. CCUG 57310]QKF93137.1 hypothetical protein CORI_1985 [Campylobacter sp. CCUG 57310]
MNSTELFSDKRLSNYTSEAEHRDNFLLMQKLAPKLGILEIITRNKVAKILNIDDDTFISRQTFGYWVTLLNIIKIHNDLVCLDSIDFSRYSKYNRQIKSGMLHYKKVKIAYSLILTIRNRAFHFENLYKLNKNGAPRISTKHDEIIVGIDPDLLESFIDDILECFDNGLKEYFLRGL